MKHTLVLLRHGESEWNLENRFTGWTDVDLTEKGTEEAKAAGRLMKAEGYHFDVAYTSYLKRANHTLALALAEMGEANIPVVRSWKLNERHYGALQGLNKAETAKKYGEEQVHIWRRSFDVQPPALTPDDERNPAKQALYAQIDSKELLLTESLKDTIARVILLSGGNRASNERGRDRSGRRTRQFSAGHGDVLRSPQRRSDHRRQYSHWRAAGL